METDFGLSVLYGNQRKPQPILSCNGCRNRNFKIPLKLKLIKRKNISLMIKLDLCHAMLWGWIILYIKKKKYLCVGSVF
jgi:hypothetical protein